jgi:cystathionine beta-synthase
MKTNGFTDEVTEKAEETKKLQWGGATIKDLKLAAAVTVSETTSTAEAIKIMQEKGFDQLPVTSSANSSRLVGLISLGDALAKVAAGRVTLEDPSKKAMFKFTKKEKFAEVSNDTPLSTLENFFNTNHSAVVTETVNGVLEARHVVTKVDLLAYLVKQKASV